MTGVYGNLADPFDGQRTVLQQFGILFMNFNFACYALSTRLQPSSNYADIYEYVTTKGLKEYFCVVMACKLLLWPMPLFHNSCKRVLHLSV